MTRPRSRKIKVHPDHVAQARRLAPIHEREAFGQRVMLFDGVAGEHLAGLGDVRTPSVADLFVARLSAVDIT